MSDSLVNLEGEFEVELTVTSVAHPANDVAELCLARVDDQPLPAWTPGAHIDVVLGPELVRQYSLCGDPADLSSYRIAVLRESNGRGGSAAVHRLAVGDVVTMRGPRNNFALHEAREYIFIGGGIGITPLVPMIGAVAASGAPWHLFYGGRTRASMACVPELTAYGDRVRLVPQDEEGLLDLATILAAPRVHTLIYCCGPEPLLNAVEEHATRWPAGALKIERFTAKEIDTEGDDSFDLVLERTGVSVRVAADQTVFDAMRAAGVGVLGSCLEGICGTCETAVLEGDVDHRDSVLEPDEQEAMDAMMVCVSRARGDRLVLDA
jgi:ferredoxin-NADP reductase